MYFGVFCDFASVFVFLMYNFASLDADNETDELPSPLSTPLPGK